LVNNGKSENNGNSQRYYENSIEVDDKVNLLEADTSARRLPCSSYFGSMPNLYLKNAIPTKLSSF